MHGPPQIIWAKINAPRPRAMSRILPKYRQANCYNRLAPALSVDLPISRLHVPLYLGR